MMEKKFGAAEAAGWVWENMTKDPKKTGLLLLIVGAGILVAGFLYAFGGNLAGFFFGSDTSVQENTTTYAPQNTENSVGVLQVQGNNNVINQPTSASRQTINTNPMLYGGTDEINLDNAGTLKLLPSFDRWKYAQAPRLALTSPVKNNDGSGESYLYWHKDVYRFDLLENRNHEVSTGVRVFVVTLLEARALGQNSPDYEYDFGVLPK